MVRTVGSSTLRGGQTIFHGLRMWGQLLRAGFLLAAFSVVAVPGWFVWERTSGYEWYAAAMVTVAEAKLGLGYQRTSRQEVRQPDGSAVVSTLPDIAASPRALAMREKLKEVVFAGALLGAKASVAAIGLFLALFWIRGRQLNARRRIRGAELTSMRQLRRRIRPLHRRALGLVSATGKHPPYRIADVPYPERAETQHTIVSGTTGSGKTVLISDLVAQIRARAERCVVYDKMGSYTRAFFEPGRDVLLNPLDARSPRWSPFYEARSPRDFDTMAAALIPQQKDTVDPFWVTAARQLFANGAGVLRERGIKENRVLVDHLLKTDLTALAQAMEGTVAQSIVDPENPKTALSVRAMLTANIGALEYLPDTGPPFSIRDWVSDEERGGFLFLTSRGDQHASLRGLISTWLEIAVNAMLSLEQDDARRIWVVLDELPTLHQVPSLQPGLAESRQFGGCFVLGIQVISALRDLYGRNGAETISGLCGTRVVLAAPDRDTAQWSADSLGRSEVEEVSEGFSYGANTIRDGVSLTPKRELRALALASEIMQLQSLHGWLRFPGPLPVAPIRLDYVKRPKAAERFVPRCDAGRNEAGAVAKPSGLTETEVDAAPEAADPRGELLSLPPPDPEPGRQSARNGAAGVDAKPKDVPTTVDGQARAVEVPAGDVRSADGPGEAAGTGDADGGNAPGEASARERAAASDGPDGTASCPDTGEDDDSAGGADGRPACEWL